jgi:putative hydrolase of HD superfamily
MFNYALASKLYTGFSVLRWNDFVRPTEIVEIEHQALKAFVSYFIILEAESNGVTINYDHIINGHVFDLMSKISTSDIQHEIMSKIKSDSTVYDALKSVMLSGWKSNALNIGDKIYNAFKEYIDIDDTTKESIEYQILHFSHKYATYREFELLRKFNDDDPDVSSTGDKIKNDFRVSGGKDKIQNYQTVIRLLDPSTATGVNEIPVLLKFIERLRNQIRWSQTPRIPLTSVLGHSMYVAVLTYFMCKEIGQSGKRLANNFFAALFHDLPESLTRDIISPVKKASKELEELIAKKEKEECEEKIMKRVPDWMEFPVRYVTGLLDAKSKFTIYGSDYTINGNSLKVFGEYNEFSNRYLKKNEIKFIPYGKDEIEYGSEYTEPMEEIKDLKESESAIDGKLIKVCDEISAYMEARMSTQYGLRSPDLISGVERTKENCRQKHVYNLNISDFFESVTF